MVPDLIYPAFFSEFQYLQFFFAFHWLLVCWLLRLACKFVDLVLPICKSLTGGSALIETEKQNSPLSLFGGPLQSSYVCVSCVFSFRL